VKLFTPPVSGAYENATIAKSRGKNPNYFFAWVQKLSLRLNSERLLTCSEIRMSDVGQTGNLAERGFPRSHHAYTRWVRAAAGKQLLLAYFPAQGLTDDVRRQLESAIMQVYNQPANRTLDVFPRR
jgi:hypothetical protein